jgi:hypothetical protein
VLVMIVRRVVLRWSCVIVSPNLCKRAQGEVLFPAISVSIGATSATCGTNPLPPLFMTNGFGRHRADADYYPRLYSMLLDQIEIVALDGKGAAEMFIVEFAEKTERVPLAAAKEFIIARWERFLADGTDRRFKVYPAAF